MYLNRILKTPGKKYPKIKFKNICFDSRKVKKNDIFFAINGNKTSGIKYVKEVIKKGVVAIISDKKINILDLKIPIIYVKNIRKSLSQVSAEYYKKKPNYIVAVTGTNGKTSVANFFNQILNLNKIQSASIGTLGINSKILKKKTELTTMDSLFLHKHLMLLKKNKVNHVIVEASSHGLDQNRLDYIKFKSGIFTNLSHDHLDYHKNMKSYFNSKMYLFKKILKKNSTIITDIDNKEFSNLKKISLDRNLEIKTIGFSKSSIKILNHKYLDKKQLIEFNYKSRIYKLEIPLIGHLQCKNLLMSILAAVSVGVGINKIVNIIKKIKPVEGRLELVALQKNNSKIILDFAHTPHALDQTLDSIKNHFKKPISIVFGCGGERDIQKRSLMGKIAKKYCNKIFITDDNPRMENAKNIRRMIIGHNKNLFFEIPDRKKAIEIAVKNLDQDEILLVAGKGHEKFQNFGKYKIKFSDKKVIKDSIKLNKIFLNNYNWKFNILKNSIKQKKLKSFKFQGFSINSNKIKKNNLFIALSGKKKDGHDYAKHAIKKGAVKILVHRKLNKIKINKKIRVLNTFKTLNKIGFNTRTSSSAKIIGITGSSGKTTLKNMLSDMLLNYGEVQCSPLSYNNHYGVPLSLSNLEQNTKYGVFEIGMSQKGEIKKLSKIVRPHIAIITNISAAHIKNFNNIKEIAKAKSEIIENITDNGSIVLNKDDNFFNFFCKKAKNKKINIISFSFKKKADVYLKKILKNNGHYKLTINIKNKDYEFYSLYNFKNLIQNILSTISIISLMNLDLSKIKKSFMKFSTPAGRGDISKINIYKKNIQLIDESYNANPLSMESAIDNLNKFKDKSKRKILILGDMLELGINSKKYHKLLSEKINKTNISKVYVYGNYIKETYNNLIDKKKGEVLNKQKDIIKIFQNNINKNDIVMIKGSNATGLFKISQNLKKGKLNAI